jgi:nucleotide-binding universal stress UspA family protein
VTDQPETIVVGYDGGEPSQRALGAAIADARTSGRRLVAVAVRELVLEPGVLPVEGWVYVPPIPSEGPVELQPLLTDARERMAEADVDGEAVWGFGEPALEILRVARESHAVRIFVGHHHHSRLSRLLHGDTAANIQELADCEVVVTD